MILGKPDASGRKKPEIQKGSEFKIKTDLVIKALGFDPEDIPKLFWRERLARLKHGEQFK